MQGIEFVVQLDNRYTYSHCWGPGVAIAPKNLFCPPHPNKIYLVVTSKFLLHLAYN